MSVISRLISVSSGNCFPIFMRAIISGPAPGRPVNSFAALTSSALPVCFGALYSAEKTSFRTNLRCESSRKSRVDYLVFPYTPFERTCSPSGEAKAFGSGDRPTDRWDRGRQRRGIGRRAGQGQGQGRCAEMPQSRYVTIHQRRVTVAQLRPRYGACLMPYVYAVHLATIRRESRPDVAPLMTSYLGRLTIWRPLLPYGYSYKAFCALPDRVTTSLCNFELSVRVPGCQNLQMTA